MLSVDGFSVRRYFLSDSQKSLNQRLVDYRRFDPDLQHLKRALNSGKNESRALENGVATLLHLLGANTVAPPSTDTPDVIAETNGKRIALVECTIRVENLREKVGKLVNRRETFIYDSSNSSSHREVLAILVVNQPRITIVNEDKYLADNQVLLITLEDINLALVHMEVPQDLDKLFVEKMQAMRLLIESPFGNLVTQY
jgi:hypothetical protein